MTIQVQQRTTDRHVWALKPVSANKFYALVTNSCGYEMFFPNDTIVWECEFDNPEFTDMLYQVMNRVMLYQNHVNSYYTKRWYRWNHRGDNHIFYKMIEPKIKLFNQSKFVTPDSTMADVDSLMTYKPAETEERYKPIPEFKRLTLAYAQQNDDKYKYLYALAVPKGKEDDKDVSYAAVYITAFMSNDPEFEKYRSFTNNAKIKTDFTTSMLGYNNADRIQRFRDYFTKNR